MIDPAELAAEMSAAAASGAAEVGQRLASGLHLARSLGRRQGTITASNNDGTVMVRLGDATDPVPARRLASYLPTVGDDVWLLRDDGDLLVLGRVATERPNLLARSGADVNMRTSTSTVYEQVAAWTATVRTGRSGQLLIGHSCIADNSSTFSSFQSFQVERVDNAAVHTGPADHTAVVMEGTDRVGAGWSYPLSFDPNTEYRLRLMHRVTGATGAWENRRVWAVPL